MKKKSGLGVFWSATWPLLIYSAAQNVMAVLGMIVMVIISAILNADESGMVDQNTVYAEANELWYQYMVLFILIAALVCIPLYYHMIKKDREKAGEQRHHIPIANKDILVIILTSAAAALAANNIIALTPLPVWFPGYEEVNETLDAGGMLLQILTAGVFGCAVEELSLRGITYLRMKRHWGKRTAMILSALIFGIYHMNVVQAVYAFFLGLYFAWLYERYDSLWAPIIGHMSANLFVILLSESTVLDGLFSTLLGFCLITCTAVLVCWYGIRYMKSTDPQIELEFVEKEPDTLQGLAEEYKEQKHGEE